MLFLGKQQVAAEQNLANYTPLPERKVVSGKQNGFHFTAENCIGCHACETACSEKNCLPAETGFRKVGYVEGGQFPNALRVYTSIACNHCSNPVCLQGCPTSAYSRDEEFGAIIQDPNICIGCGYCTWVCPYGAPQMNHEKGQVEKCDMCIDRLRKGQKPACAAACLGKALDFGEIAEPMTKQLPPEFPTIELTEPNIRFHKVRGGKTMPNQMVRSDSLLNFDAENKRPLSTHENPLLAFTILTQISVGAFATLFLTGMAEGVAATILLAVIFTMQSIAMLISTLHLGKPLKAYRAIKGMRLSPISHEVIFVAGFHALLGGYLLMAVVPLLPMLHLPAPPMAELMLTAKPIIGWGATIIGSLSIFAMSKVYLLKNRPLWNHWSSVASFTGTSLTAGVALAGMAISMGGGKQGGLNSLLLVIIFAIILLMRGRESLYNKLKSGSKEEQISFKIVEKFYKKFAIMAYSSDILLFSTICIIASIPTGRHSYMLWVAAFTFAIIGRVLERAIFFAAVEPTAVASGTFWKNRLYEQTT